MAPCPDPSPHCTSLGASSKHLQKFLIYKPGITYVFWTSRGVGHFVMGSNPHPSPQMRPPGPDHIQVIDRFFMNLFNTNVMDTVKYCQDQFGFELPSVLIDKHRDKFLARYKQFELNHLL